MSHSKSPLADSLLAQAEQEAERYQWTAAAKLHEDALKEVDVNQNPIEAARIHDLLAYCRYKAAFQCKDRAKFKESMGQAESSYKDASNLYEKCDSAALSKRARARSLFAQYWIQDSSDERRSIIQQCINLGEESVTLLENQSDKKSLAEAHLDLLSYYAEAFILSPERDERNKLFEKILGIGGLTTREFEDLDLKRDLVKSLVRKVTTTCLIADTLSDPAKVQEIAKPLQIQAAQAMEVAQQLGTSYELAFANFAASAVASVVGKDWPKALSLVKSGIQFAEKTGDSSLIGELCLWGIVDSFWTGWGGIEDAERASVTLREGISLASEAIRHLEIPLQRQDITVAYGWDAECYRALNDLSADLKEKKELLNKAIELARKGLEYSDPRIPGDSVHALSKSLYFLATLEPDVDRRVQLLHESLKFREHIVQLSRALIPQSWDMGVMYNYLALVKAELSDSEKNPQAKLDLLQNAVKDMQQCIEICTMWATNQSYMHSTASYVFWHGDILAKLYRQTGSPEDANKAIRAYQDAITLLEKSGYTEQIPPIRWSISKTYDTLGNYKEASEEFHHAAEDYRGCCESRASASEFTELASYMDAWSLIEKARLAHKDEQYSTAADNYTQAASLLRPTPRLNPLAKHYEACAHLENGEALSRQEKEDEAVSSFTQATSHFEAAGQNLEAKLKQVTAMEEEKELRYWLRITEARMRYAQGRADLEKARLLDQKGEKTSSLTLYRKASGIFKTLLPESQAEQSRREIETLILFCDAWAKMKEAETKASPDFYTEAAELFVKAEKASENQKSDLLALANASICRALATGTRFRRARDSQLYSEIKRDLETAADYYQEGGYTKAANWTRATQRLFDALLYLADAESEKEARKKAELYHLAEQHLQLAAKIYGDAGFTGKRDESLRHLERAREEKAILLTPLEVLSENPTASAGAASPVSLLRDQPLGTERYESANIVGNLSLRQRDVNVGGDLAVEVEIANVGKTPAMLMKLENLAPEGFEIQHDKTPLHVEDGFINMKGKRLEYLKTDEVKVALKALRKGAYKLRPRILFVDDKGSYRSYDFEPTEVTVSELGISGWLRGSGR